MRREQKRLDEYVVISPAEIEIPSRANWENRIHILERWINKESVYAKRALRLRSYAYLKMPWFSTSRA
jgi:hypothetical protein